MKFVFRLALPAAACLLLFSLAFAQNDAAKDAKSGKAKQEKVAEAPKEVRDAFEKQFTAWKKLLGQLQVLRLKYRALDSREEQKQIEKEYFSLIDKGREMAPKVRASAIAYYAAAPRANDQVEKFLASEAQKSFDRDDLDDAARLAKMLADGGYNNATIFRIAGISQFEIGNVEDGQKYLELAKENKALDFPSENLLENFDDHKKAWEQEKELRQKEAEADNLPRVLIKTTQGDITVELFEDQAPNTVANFITLVEKDFYNDVAFHRVIQHFVAQTGDPKGDGTGGPGYTIACECEREDHRKHFLGSLSMAHAGKDTGGSQFFFVFQRTRATQLDGKHTVFGRVIDGKDVLTRIRRINPRDPETFGTPDKIVSAKVLRKRDHEYTVQKMDDEDADGEADKDAAKEDSEKKSSDDKGKQSSKKKDAKSDKSSKKDGKTDKK